MSTAFLSALDPTLISGVKDRLAAGYAARIDGALAEIAGFLELEAEACPQAEQKRQFMSAARLLTAKGDGLRPVIASEVQAKFAERISKLGGHAAKAPRLTLESLTLVRDDQMQEEIAIGNCVKRLRDQSDHELYALTQRMSMLLGRERLADSVNPVYPGILVEGLMAGLAAICPDSTQRLILFKAFGPILLDLVPEIYESANQYLLERGIDLPVDSPYGRPILTPDRPFTTLQAASVPMPVVGELAASLNMALESRLAKPLARAGPESRGRAIAPNATTSTRLLLHVQSALAREDVSSKSIITTLVDIIFENWLQDSRMSPAWKQLMAKTRDPILAAALADTAVFSNPHHVVRELIDLITEFGLLNGTDAGNGASLQSVAAIVDRLAGNRQGSPDSFALACRQLDELLYHHEEAALHRDAWLLALLDKEEREVAVAAANVTIAQRLLQRELSSVVRAFIQTVWRDVLVRDFLDGGERGESWRLGLATVDELLKSLAPASTREEKRAQLKALPSLICLLQEGISMIDAGPELCRRFFSELELTHSGANQGRSAESLPDPVTGEGMVYSRKVKATMKPGAALPSPAATLAGLGLVCGAWVCLGREAAANCMRLNWITPVKGTCVLRDYKSDTVQSMTATELKRLIDTGQATVIKNVGFADELFLAAFKQMAQKNQGSIATVIAHRNDAATGPAMPGMERFAGIDGLAF